MTLYPEDRPELPSGVLTLPAHCYTAPDWFQREIERIHGLQWLCAGRTEQVPSPGSYFLRRAAGANVIVLRDQEGEIAAFHNVCRHRGTLLCKEDEGMFTSRIQCPYHGWTYDLDGKLVSAPHMERVQGFRETDYPLERVAVAAWDGHVFINLAAHPSSFEEHLAGLPAKFRPWRMEELKLVERRLYHLKANWKLIVQNYSECLHCPIAHPQLQRRSHYMSGANEPAQPTYLGGRMDLRDGVETLTLADADNRSCFPGLSAEDRRHVYFYAILPNLLLSLHPDYMVTCTLWPVAVDRTDVICEWHFHPDEIAKADFNPGGAIDFWDMTNRQDWELTELAQEGISSRGYQPGPYSNREELLHALDCWVLERVGCSPPAV